MAAGTVYEFKSSQVSIALVFEERWRRKGSRNRLPDWHTANRAKFGALTLAYVLTERWKALAKRKC